MSCFLRLLVLFIDKVPVDDAEPFIDVINAAVLILQVVSMFPDVQAEQRSLPFCQRVILVGSGKNFKLVAITPPTGRSHAQPLPKRPAAAAANCFLNSS